jgi:hypothetical protein
MSNVLALQTVSSAQDEVVVQGISSIASIGCTCNETLPN